MPLRTALAPLLLALLAGCATSPGKPPPPETASTSPSAWEKTYSQAVAAYDSGDYDRSADLARASHSLAATATNEYSRETAGTLSLLAAAELALGRYESAAAGFEQSIAILRRDPATDPADLTGALNNMGELYRQQGELDRALPWYQEAYRTAEASLGPHDAARALASLALIRHELGDLEQAGRDYVAALEQLGQTDALPLERARIQANHADLLLRTGQAEQAQAAMEHVLAIEEANLAPGHPDIAYSLNTLGVIADAQQRYKDAVNLYGRAITIRTHALPPGHPAIASVLGNRAGAHESMGETAKARDDYDRAISILREAHGDNHPDVAEYVAALKELE